jgi:surface protein
VQAHSVTNTHTLSGESETLASLLDLRMRVAAGVLYSSKVGSDTTTTSNSDSVVLPLGPSTPYRLAGAPSVTSSNSKYMVNNSKIEVPVSINANGLAVEGLSTVVAFITQSSNYIDSTDTQSGDGPTVLAVFGPGSNRTYTVGSNASAISTTDNLAPGEVATTTSENLSDAVDDAAAPFTLTLALGTLAADDATVFSFPTTGFNPIEPIQIILIVTTRLGHRVLGTTLTYQPPLLLSRLANGVTIRYMGTDEAVGNAWSQLSKPRFVYEDPRNTGTSEYFAVVIGTTANGKIGEYAKTAASTFFTPPGENSPVPFNNIVTTLVDNMSSLFNNAITFNKSIRSWDTSAVYTMDFMFAGANAFNQDVSSFDTSNVQNMEYMFSMGGIDPQFNNAGLPGIGSWNTSKVTTMKGMFQNAMRFNQNLTAWVVSQVTQNSNMFYSATNMLAVNYPQFSSQLMLFP